MTVPCQWGGGGATGAALARAAAHGYIVLVPSRDPLVLIALLAGAFGLSAWQPYEMATCWMDVAPVFLALPLVLFLDHRFGLTSLVLRLLAFEALVVALGAIAAQVLLARRHDAAMGLRDAERDSRAG